LCQAEERRQRALQPYLVGAPARGVIGNSKYAERLRKGVLTAARDPKRGPVMIFGEPGLGKANLAALVHFGSPSRNRPMVQVGIAGGCQQDVLVDAGPAHVCKHTPPPPNQHYAVAC
jgi:transcriptional regulator with AAA-type ATPase domain